MSTTAKKRLAATAIAGEPVSRKPSQGNQTMETVTTAAPSAATAEPISDVSAIYNMLTDVESPSMDCLFSGHCLRDLIDHDLLPMLKAARAGGGHATVQVGERELERLLWLLGEHQVHAQLVYERVQRALDAVAAVKGMILVPAPLQALGMARAA